MNLIDLLSSWPLIFKDRREIVGSHSNRLNGDNVFSEIDHPDAQQQRPPYGGLCRWKS